MKMKKAAFVGLLGAAAILMNIGPSGQAATNDNSGVSVIQSCNLAAPINILALGQNYQGGGGGQGSCGSGSGTTVNDNSGVSVLQACNTAAPVNILGLGENNQNVNQGSCGGSGVICNDCGVATESSGIIIWPPSSGGPVNQNSGVSVLQSCNTAAPINILGLGENNQSVNQGPCGSSGGLGFPAGGSWGWYGPPPCSATNCNSGLSVAQLVNTALPINILGLGENNQSVGQGTGGLGTLATP